MSADGTCPYCDETNSYQNVTCSNCGEELPWAAWQQAERDAPTPIGAERVDPNQLRGWEAQNPVGISLAGGPFMRLITIGTALLVTFGIAYFGYSAIKSQSQKPGAIASNSAAVKEGYGKYGNQLDRQMSEQETTNR